MLNKKPNTFPGETYWRVWEDSRLDVCDGLETRVSFTGRRTTRSHLLRVDEVVNVTLFIRNLQKNKQNQDAATIRQS